MIKIVVVFEVPTCELDEAVNAIRDGLITEEVGTLWHDAEISIESAEVVR